MADRHFEIIVSGRQLAVLVVSVVVLLIVAFALGVTAGLRTSPVAAKEVAGPVEMVSPPTWPPASEQVAALALVLALRRGARMRAGHSIRPGTRRPPS